jgi:protease I
MAMVPKKDTYQPDAQPLDASTVLIITADNVEDLEFFYPYYRFIEAGYKVDVATPNGTFKGKNGLGLQETKKLEDVLHAENYVLLYLPGGKAPAELMKNNTVIKLTREFARTEKIIAAICHGPQILAAAKVIEGRSIAAWPEVEEELTKAGATYINEQSVCDENFVTGRWPGDLPAFMNAVIAKLKHSEAAKSQAA